LAAELLNWMVMVRVILAVAVFLLTVRGGGIVCAQGAEDPNALLAKGPSFLKKIRVDRGGGLHITKVFAIVFGGIKQGSSMAVGPAVSHEFDNGGFAQVKGVYSIRHFKLVQARLDSGPLLHHRAMVSTRVRWQDAPELSLYALGPDSSQARAEYGERKAEWSGFIRYGLAQHLTATGGSGFERYAIDAGFLDFTEDEHLGVVPDEPGLATRPWFVHSYGSIVFDTRLSPDFSRTGTALMGTAHDYHDMHDGHGSFHGYEAGIAHLFPMVRTDPRDPAGWKGALGLAARAWLTDSGQGSTVPFFLMPTLGGGDFLRGYASYRFRDRNALTLSAEYCWAVHPMVDLAALYEAGSVAPTLHRLGSDIAQSAGGGVRVHTRTAGLLSLDLARGRDGVQFSIGFSIAGG
jgi:hypothetical protein